jgi:hypothetical protein
VVSSINSTRTCVTPPREPVRPRTPIYCQFCDYEEGCGGGRTGDFYELDGLLCCVHFGGSVVCVLVRKLILLFLVKGECGGVYRCCGDGLSFANFLIEVSVRFLVVSHVDDN